ncbi:MAG: hypothetical protein JXO48_01845 [Deltaproteobacteria bacterium]|nr:hypothetical protein [Deltaproteobacteria bacterium]
MKFIADPTLGKLVKLLRILGYDTVYSRGGIDRTLLNRGLREDRTVLTRRRDMTRRDYLGSMLLIRSDRPVDQVAEVLHGLSLHPDPRNMLTLCLHCNIHLEDMPRQDAEGLVPPYVFQTQESFLRCPRCRRVYWAGTHRENMLRYLRKHNLIHLP